MVYTVYTVYYIKYDFFKFEISNRVYFTVLNDFWDHSVDVVPMSSMSSTLGRIPIINEFAIDDFFLVGACLINFFDDKFSFFILDRQLRDLFNRLLWFFWGTFKSSKHVIK